MSSIITIKTLCCGRMEEDAGDGRKNEELDGTDAGATAETQQLVAEDSGPEKADAVVSSSDLEHASSTDKPQEKKSNNRKYHFIN